MLNRKQLNYLDDNMQGMCFFMSDVEHITYICVYFNVQSYEDKGETKLLTTRQCHLKLLK